MGATRRIGAIPSLNPAALPGLIGWWDATKITGQADNTFLGSWPDSSGHANIFFGNNGGGTYYSTTPGKTINGHPAVWLPGTVNTFYQINITAPQPFSIVFVAKITNTGPGTTGLLGSNAAGNTPWVGKALATGTLKANNGGGGAGTLALDTGLHMIASIAKGAASTLWLDATSQASDTGTIGMISTNTTMLGTFDGSSSNATLNGPLCEVLLGTADWTAQMAQIRSYCQSKWGTP